MSVGTYVFIIHMVHDQVLSVAYFLFFFSSGGPEIGVLIFSMRIEIQLHFVIQSVTSRESDGLGRALTLKYFDNFGI